jgi:hypothetical protein
MKQILRSLPIALLGIQETFMTSEIMDGEYNPAADSIWTYYYKCLDPNK